MATRKTWQLWSGFWVTSLGTLASRVLGLVRDMATAALLGLGEGGVMDAFVIAFRVPNLLRRIFGEGALAASFLPVFSAQYEREPRRAWQILSVLLVLLTALLSALVLLGEAACAAIAWTTEPNVATTGLLGLTAALLPYMVLVCLAAQASAALQALLHFHLPALTSSLLNLCWLAAVWFVAPYFGPDKLAQAYVIAGAILVSGVLQFAIQLPLLARLGFRFDFDWSASRHACGQILRAMVPITLGMAVTQLNTLMDSLIAWGLSASPDATRTVAWLGHAVEYPMQSGAVSAIYYGERFYQLPVGLLGVAIATVTYPLVSRHAARGDFEQLGEDLTLGLRLVWFTALPAGVGIILVAHPLVKLLFERGEFTADDTARAASTIACYASGVWAYCALPVLVRGFYAVGNRAAPAKLGLVAVALNFVLNVTLIWPLAENGLAISTAIAAGVQVALLALVFSRTSCTLAWRELGATIAKSTIACAVMVLAVAAILRFTAPPAASTRPEQIYSLAAAIGGGAAVYLLIARALSMSELRLLFVRPKAAGDGRDDPKK